MPTEINDSTLTKPLLKCFQVRYSSLFNPQLKRPLNKKTGSCQHQEWTCYQSFIMITTQSVQILGGFNLLLSPSFWTNRYNKRIKPLVLL